jgi:hypothetical protein
VVDVVAATAAPAAVALVGDTPLEIAKLPVPPPPDSARFVVLFALPGLPLR